MRRLRPTIKCWATRTLSIALISCSFAVAGCDSGGPCDPRLLVVYEREVAVTATDSVTGEAVPSATAVLMVGNDTTSRNSIGSDVSKYPINLHVFGAGAYTLSVAAPDYSTWSNTINVNSICRQPAIPITARMQKQP